MKSQGLPFSTIVLAVISILILVLVVFFVTGGLSRILPQAGRYIDERAAIRAECARLLNDIQQRLQLGNYPDKGSIENAFKASEFCSKRFILENRTVYCYSPAVGMRTSFVVYTDAGVAVNCVADHNGCECR